MISGFSESTVNCRESRGLFILMVAERRWRAPKGAGLANPSAHASAKIPLRRRLALSAF